MKKAVVQKHPSTPKPSTLNPKKEKASMATKTKKQATKTTPNLTLPIGTTTSSPPTGSTDAPPTETTAPPSVSLPAIPSVTTHLAKTSGVFPWAAQLAAVPSVLHELQDNTEFVATFVSLVPSANRFATDLANATGWTTLRQALTAYLGYVRTQEAIMWKVTKSEIESLDLVFRAVAATNPQLLVEYPALAGFLQVAKVSAQHGAVTRAAEAKVKAAQSATASTPTTAATTAPVVTPNAATIAGGGVVH